MFNEYQRLNANNIESFKQKILHFELHFDI